MYLHVLHFLFEYYTMSILEKWIFFHQKKKNTNIFDTGSCPPCPCTKTVNALARYLYIGYYIHALLLYITRRTRGKSNKLNFTDGIPVYRVPGMRLPRALASVFVLRWRRARGAKRNVNYCRDDDDAQRVYAPPPPPPPPCVHNVQT